MCYLFNGDGTKEAKLGYIYIYYSKSHTFFIEEKNKIKDKSESKDIQYFGNMC